MAVGRLHAHRRPTGDAHRAAADHGGGQERNRVGQVGFDVPVPRRDRAGADLPAVGRESSTSTPASRSIDTVIATCGADGTDVAGVHDRQAVGERGARQQQARRRTATTPTRRSRRCRRRPLRGRCTGTAGRRRRCRRRARAARPAAVRSGGPGPARRRRTVTDSVLSAATGGTNRSTVPASPQSMPAPGPGASVPLTVSSVSSPSTRRRPEGPQRADHQVGVAAAQRAADASMAPAVGGQRGQHQRAVGLRLRAGHGRRWRARDPAPSVPASPSRLPSCPLTCSSGQCPRLPRQLMPGEARFLLLRPRPQRVADLQRLHRRLVSPPARRRE